MTPSLQNALAAIGQSIGQLPGSPVIAAIVLIDASGNRISASSGPVEQYSALATGLTEAAELAADHGHPRQPAIAAHSAEIQAERIALAAIGRAWLSSRRVAK